MIRLLVASAALGAIIAGTAAWTLRGEVAYAAPLPPAAPPEDHWRQASEGCVRGGGTWWQGMEGKVLVGRCRPWLDLGVAPVARVGGG